MENLHLASILPTDHHFQSSRKRAIQRNHRKGGCAKRLKGEEHLLCRN
jgi:hypothetical protein